MKQRAYGSSGDAPAASARATLHTALSTLLRLFAPHLPFVTEEVWSWWQEGSVHRSEWPGAAPLRAVAGEADAAVYPVAAAVLGARTEANQVVVHDSADRLERLRAALDDVRDAARAREIELVEGDAFVVEVELAEPDAA